MSARIDMKRLLPAWEQFRRTTDIAPIRDEAHYERMVAMLNALLDEAGGDEHHAAMALVDIVGDLIEDYEAAHHPLPETTGLAALKFLMEQHGLVSGSRHSAGFRRASRAGSSFIANYATVMRPAAN